MFARRMSDRLSAAPSETPSRSGWGVPRAPSPRRHVCVCVAPARATPLWIRPGLPVRLFQRGQGSTMVKDWGDQPNGQEQLDALQCDVCICSLREPYSRGLIGSLAKTSVCVCVCVSETAWPCCLVAAVLSSTHTVVLKQVFSQHSLLEDTARAVCSRSLRRMLACLECRGGGIS